MWHFFLIFIFSDGSYANLDIQLKVQYKVNEHENWAISQYKYKYIKL